MDNRHLFFLQIFFIALLSLPACYPVSDELKRIEILPNPFLGVTSRPSLLAKNLNPRIDEILRRAFEKNPRRRWYAIGDVRVEIEAIRANPTVAAGNEPPPVVQPKPLWKRAIPVLVTSLLAIAITSAGFCTSSRRRR